MEKKPKSLHGAVGLIIGVPIGAIGAALMKHGRFGMTPFYSVSLALYDSTGILTMGMWNTIFQLGLILTLIIVRRRFFPRYILSFGVAFCASTILDLVNKVTASLPETMACRIICFSLGFLIMAVGISLLARCRLPVAPMNLFPRELAEITGREFRQLKLWFDLGCLMLTLVVSWLFAHRLVGVGVGTVVAVLTGPLTGLIISFLDRHIVFHT